MNQPGFFDVEKRLARLNGLGNQLEAFSRTVDFEVLRPDLAKALAYSDGSGADGQTQDLINEQLSCMRFLGNRPFCLQLPTYFMVIVFSLMLRDLS